MNSKCCDNCKYYEWFWDKCNKWDCEVDDRSCCSEFSPNKSFLESQYEWWNYDDLH